ncbi:MAG: hypothetical protein AB7I42_25750 [Bradyrhizobium sp.]|uniref:hypothetical protein n=1 Tax=Bradyrhizobium sp. TaxID=376 RepID=UPI003D0E96EB
MPGVIQSEFARLMGVNRSTVTRWKQEGRLALDAEGKIDVEASRARIKQTEGTRDDVAARHAEARGAEIPAAATAAPQPPTDPDTATQEETTRAHWTMRKERALALAAEREEMERRRALVPISEAKAITIDITTAFRTAAENLPHRVAPQLVGKDLDTIRATLKQEVQDLLHEVERDLQAQHRELEGEGMAA